jgi:hypothetical protein
MKGSPMSHKNDKKCLIRKNSRRLQKLKEQQALLGISTPSHILLEIEDTEAEIAKLRMELEAIDEQTVSKPISSDFEHSTETTDINNRTHYQTVPSGLTPALVIYLLDVSASMSQQFGEKSRIEVVFNALQKTIERLLHSPTKGDTIVSKYRFAIYTYSHKTIDLLNGVKTAAEIGHVSVPILVPLDMTDTAGGFLTVERLLEQELPNIQDCPAPLVCHILDGEYNGPDPIPIIERIQEMSVNDGNVLVENIYIARDLLIEPVQSIENWLGIRNTTQIRSHYARELVEVSSTIPDNYHSNMIKMGYDIARDAKMFVPGVIPELIELGFDLSIAMSES